VASAVNQVSDRQQYAVALKEAALACFDNIRPLCQYAEEMANAMFSIANFQDVYLRQVQLFAVKPLRDYVAICYPKIMADYAELEKRRDKYDMERGKNPISSQRAQQQLLEQANILEASLNQIAEHQMMLAKCFDTLTRGEYQLFKESKGVIDAVKAPDYKKRWGP